MKALITGITGMDGSHLADLLLAKGYEVHGIIRRSASFNTGRVDHLVNRSDFKLHYGDVTEPARLARLVSEVEPDEVYHLAAQSHVRVSFDEPDYTGEVVGLGTQHLLEAVWRLCPCARVYIASSSEMFGASPPPQSERTPFHPRSPYGCAKVYAHYLGKHYRERGLFVANGMLFNHTSERRGETFVSRKISRAVARIKRKEQQILTLGNCAATRDWGYAPDYVEAMWRMLQQSEPDDFVIGTGESHSVQEFVELAFARVGLRWQDHVQVDPHYFRPTEVDALRADASKARQVLGWAPRVHFQEIVDRLVDHDLTA